MVRADFARDPPARSRQSCARRHGRRGAHAGRRQARSPQQRGPPGRASHLHHRHCSAPEGAPWVAQRSIRSAPPSLSPRAAFSAKLCGTCFDQLNRGFRSPSCLSAVPRSGWKPWRLSAWRRRSSQGTGGGSRPRTSALRSRPGAPSQYLSFFSHALTRITHIASLSRLFQSR